MDTSNSGSSGLNFPSAPLVSASSFGRLPRFDGMPSSGSSEQRIPKPVRVDMGVSAAHLVIDSFERPEDINVSKGPNDLRIADEVLPTAYGQTRHFTQSNVPSMSKVTKAVALSVGAVVAAIPTGADARSQAFSFAVPAGFIRNTEFSQPDTKKKVFVFEGEDVSPDVQRDVTVFLNSFPLGIECQRIFVDGGEVTIEWKTATHHAQATFEGDGSFSYAMRRGEYYAPGATVDTSAFIFPADLLEYLRTA